MEGIFYNRGLQSTPTSEQLEDRINSLSKEVRTLSDTDVRKDSLKDTLCNLSKNQYWRTVTDNTLKNIKIEARNLPFLGIGIPSDDYPVIITVMLTIFVISIWLNSRSIWAAVDTLFQKFGSDPELSVIVRIGYTFTGLKENQIYGPDQKRIAAVVEYMVYWLPVVAILLSGYAHLYYPYLQRSEDPHYYFGSTFAIVLRIILMLICFAIAVLTAVSCGRYVRATDRRIGIVHDDKSNQEN